MSSRSQQEISATLITKQKTQLNVKENALKDNVLVKIRIFLDGVIYTVNLIPVFDNIN